MAIQNHLTTLRIDAATNAILKALVSDLNFNRSQIIRRSIWIMKELTEIKQQCGEILVRTEQGEMKVLLLG